MSKNFDKNESAETKRDLEFLLGTNVVLSKEDRIRNKKRLEYMMSNKFASDFRRYNHHIRVIEHNGKKLYYNPANIAFLEIKKREKGLSNNDILRIMKGLGVSLSAITFSRKMNGKSDFTAIEMLCLIQILELDINEIIAAFNLIPTSLEEHPPIPNKEE